jgi:hypothetical protein
MCRNLCERIESVLVQAAVEVGLNLCERIERSTGATFTLTLGQLNLCERIESHDSR